MRAANAFFPGLYRFLVARFSAETLAVITLVVFFWLIIPASGGAAVETPTDEMAQKPAEEEPQFRFFSPVKKGFEGDRVFHNWFEALKHRGVEYTLNYTGEVMGNVSGGKRRGATYEGLLEAGLSLDAEKIIGWQGGSLQLSMLYPHGASLSQKFVGDLFTASNIDAYDALRLYEFWAQEELWDGKVSLRVGQLAVDKEFLSSDVAALFMSSAFGWAPFLGLNVPAPCYPVAAPGARLRIKPCDHAWLQAAIYDGNPDPGDALGNQVNPHGTRINLNEGALLLFEMAVLTDFEGKDCHHPGVYKIGGWFHTDSFTHQRWDDGGLSLSDPASSGNPLGMRKNWGLYAVTEQTVWHEDETKGEQGLSVFVRAGGSPQDRNLISFYCDAGVKYVGWLPVRDADVCGMAFAYGRMGSSARELVRDDNAFNGRNAALPDYEMALEFTYRINIKDWWSLQPDVQYIIHPGGSSTLPNSLVVGLRTTIAF